MYAYVTVCVYEFREIKLQQRKVSDMQHIVNLHFSVPSLLHSSSGNSPWRRSVTSEVGMLVVYSLM